VVALLNKAGFQAAKQFSESPQRGDILVVGNGGAVLFYVHEHEPAVLRRLVDWLQRSDFAGVIFTRDGAAGTLPMHEVHIDGRDAADVVMSFRWLGEKNQFGVPGLIDADWNRKSGQGTHATLSKYDVYNVLVATGPDFRHGFENELATTNLDIAPTVLHLLDIPRRDLEGRKLAEAFAEH
jgi:hypothetical protein